MAAESSGMEGRLKRWGAGRALLEVAWSASLITTLSEVVGWLTKGLRFLGRFGRTPALTLTLLVLLGVPLWYLAVRALRKGSGLGPVRRRAAWGALALHLLVITLLAATVLRYDVVHAQAAAPSERLVVAVADFGTGPDLADSTAGREVSAYLARSLRRQIDLQPALAGEVSVRSVPLVRDEQAASGAASDSGAQLVIWGWVAEDSGAALAPTFSFFVEQPEISIELQQTPPWYDMEISGDGRLELGQLAGERAAGVVNYALGLLYLYGSDYQRAAAEFGQAVSIASQDLSLPTLSNGERRALQRTLAIYHVALGRTLAVQDKPDAARQEYLQAQQLDPQFATSYIGLGNLAYGNRRFDEALGWYDQAVALGPNKPVAWYSRGNASYYLGHYEAALSDYQQAVALAGAADPRLGLFHLVLGTTLCRLGRYDQGSQELANAASFVGTVAYVGPAADRELEGCHPAPTSAATLTPVRTPLLAATKAPSTAPSRTGVPTETPPATLAASSTTQPADETSAPTPTPGRTAASATPRPTEDGLTCVVQLSGQLVALEVDGQVDWGQVAVECLDAQQRLLERIALTGAETQCQLPRNTAMAKLWIGPALGGGAWWQRWSTEPQAVSPLIVLCIKPVATPVETLFPTSFVPPPTPPAMTETPPPAQARPRHGADLPRRPRTHGAVPHNG